MQSQLQGFELETRGARDHDLTIEHAVLRQLRLQRVDQLGEIAIERPLVPTLNEDLVDLAKDERAKTVPLRLENPSLARRELTHSLGEHRKNRRIDCELHALGLNGRQLS